MKVIIRADSSLNIGTGHVVRCLTLASHLHKQGAEITFVCRSLEGNIISLVEEKQFKVIPLIAPSTALNSSQIYENWLGVSLDDEIHEFSKVLESEKPDWVIVDHYSLTESWEANIRQRKIKVFAIDDLYRNHDCDALLDQNTLKKQATYRSLTPLQSVLFLGPKYVLLNPIFHTYTSTRNSNRIVIFFGGSDITGETVRVLKIIKNKFDDYEFDVIAGINNPFLEQIKKLSLDQNNVTLHIQTKNMADILSKAKLFLGAGGTTTWERCYLGLPGICITTADNQIQIAIELAELNVHKYLGHFDSLKDKEIENCLTVLLNDSQLQDCYSRNSLALNVSSKLPELVHHFFK